MNNMCPRVMYRPQHVPREVCNLMIDIIKSSELEEARLGLRQDSEYNNKEVRNNSKIFLEPNHWFGAIMSDYGSRINKQAEWNFDLLDVAPNHVQLSQYIPGQLYDWHNDEDVLSRLESVQRKISVVVQLNDPSEYQGGGFFVKGLDEPILKHQGDIIAFPSFVEHKADTVTEGVRYSAALWMLGNHFK